MSKRLYNFDTYYEGLLEDRGAMKVAYTRTVKKAREIFEAESVAYATNTLIANSLRRSVGVIPKDFKKKLGVKALELTKHFLGTAKTADMEDLNDLLDPYISNVRMSSKKIALKLYPEFEDATNVEINSIFHDVYDLESAEGVAYTEALNNRQKAGENLFTIGDFEDLVETVKNNMMTYGIPALQELEDTVKDLVALKSDEMLFDIEEAQVVEISKAMKFEFGTKVELEEAATEAVNAKLSDLEEYNTTLTSIAAMATEAVSQGEELGISEVVIADMEGAIEPLLSEASTVFAKYPDAPRPGYFKLKKVLNEKFPGKIGYSDELADLEEAAINYADKIKVPELEDVLIKINESLDSIDTSIMTSSSIKTMNGIIHHGSNIINAAKYIDNESVQVHLGVLGDTVDTMTKERRKISDNIKTNLIDKAMTIGAGISEMESTGDVFKKISPIKIKSMLTAKVDDICSLTGERLKRMSRTNAPIAKARLVSMNEKINKISEIVSATASKVKDTKLIKTLNAQLASLKADVAKMSLKVDARLKDDIAHGGDLPVLECVERVMHRQGMIDFSNVIEKTTLAYDAEDIDDDDVQMNITLSSGLSTAALLYFNALGITRETKF